MEPSPLTFWDRAQLAVLRILSVGLGLLDRLFHIDWGERALGRMSRRWENQLANLDETLARLEQERQELHAQSDALAIHAAAIYLAARSVTQDRLRFDPDVPREDEILDATIDLLVKQRLASIETEQVGDGKYAYTIEPDWKAIHARLRDAAKQADPSVAEWYQESIRFIDETFLSRIRPPGEREPENLHGE